MKLLFSFLAGLFLIFQTSDLEALRKSYSKANLSNDNARNFIALAEKKSSSDPVISAYKSASKILEAKVTTEKNKRKSFVKSGATGLENTIASNPNNAELRVIRMSVQENLPKIVGYSKNLKEDKDFLLNNYSKQNQDLKNYIKQFAEQSKTMTATEKASFK